MNIVVHPQKGSYKVIIIKHNTVRGIGQVTIAHTSKGWRPKHFLYKRFGKKHLNQTPTKDFIDILRDASVQLTAKDQSFESFLEDFQVPYGYIDLCRICLIEDCVTPIFPGQGISYRKENICFECAKKEIRREIGYVGIFGKRSLSYIEQLLSVYRDLDRVLGTVHPEWLDTAMTLYDTLNAKVIKETALLRELPLPDPFLSRANVERLMPVQQLACEAGLLDGKHLLVVSATASGKTFIGEMAGMNNYLRGRGRILFLVPLVALANQKYQRFTEKYGSILKVALQTGVSRLNLPEMKSIGDRDINAPLIVGTYEGIDHFLRCGNKLKNIGTVIIDEVQTLEDSERGHRLDGLIARLKYLSPKAQFLYLSATIGLPHLLASKLNATLVSYDDRPVPLERHLIFVGRQSKIKYIKKLVDEAFETKSSKNFRGQSIVFTNSRARCHVIADALGKRAAPYHAGLTNQERREVEEKFLTGKIATVVTTAALASGVDFPALQVIFDSLAMGINWLSVQDFHQMSGRAGRPDFHDFGRVVILAEPGASYSRNSVLTEEEVAISLLRGEMEEVAPTYGIEESSEELVANVVVCGGKKRDLEEIQHMIIGSTEPVIPFMLERGFLKRRKDGIELLPMANVMAEHFLGVERVSELQQFVKSNENPLTIIAELDCKEVVK